ncbi:hypothetical protein K6Y31_04955 [Motilimonas cestriensis]|uniref:Uncharacterized protein n=1 Tax=Motilimonas cestriensis TaxID=2742685 RepID=A0ABS8W5A7_9GAMM|nr:hypothetical protein [Motilimonas cestriensis]MCE2594159.1 hypothetical protein [Motilimonas cestriensis]
MNSNELIQAVQQKQLEQTQEGEQEHLDAIVQNLASGSRDSAIASIGMLAGRAQMAQAIAGFSSVVNIVTLRKVKESKGYKSLKGLKSPDGGILTGTWEEFCSLIGASKSSLDERLKNADYFGEQVFESLTAIGMGVRDFRKLRKLPEEELKALVDGDSLKVSDKEEALDIIEEMAVKHRAEANALNDKIKSLEQKSKAADQLLESKNKKFLKLELELEEAKGKGTPARLKQLEEQKNQSLSQALLDAKFAVFSGLAAFEDAVRAVQDSSHPCDLDTEYESTMQQIVSRLMEGSASLGLDQTVIDALNSELALYQGVNE